MDASAWNSNSQASGFSRTSSNRTADIHTDAVGVNVRTSAGITHPPRNSGSPYSLPENCSADHFSALLSFKTVINHHSNVSLYDDYEHVLESQHYCDELLSSTAFVRLTSRRPFDRPRQFIFTVCSYACAARQ